MVGWEGSGKGRGPRSPPRSLQTLKRKGLGLDSHELELDEGLDGGEKMRKLNEGMDLTVARPRFYVSGHHSMMPGDRSRVPNPSPDPSPLFHPAEPGAAARGLLQQLPTSCR